MYDNIREKANDMALEIEELRDQLKWIPIIEREPDTTDHVLVTVKWAEDDYEVTELDYWVTKKYPTTVGREIIDHIIAWKPMPQPYKEQMK